MRGKIPIQVVQLFATLRLDGEGNGNIFPGITVLLSQRVFRGGIGVQADYLAHDPFNVMRSKTHGLDGESAGEL